MRNLAELVIGEQEPPVLPVLVVADLRFGHDWPTYTLRDPERGDREPTRFPMDPEQKTLSIGEPSPLLDNTKALRRAAHFPDRFDMWNWAVDQDEDVVYEDFPFALGKHLEVHVPTGIDIEVAGTTTPVVVWGNPGRLFANRCTSFTAIVDLTRDFDAKSDPDVVLRDVSTATLMLWNANGFIDCENVDELNLGADRATVDARRPDIQIRGTRFLRTVTRDRNLSIRGVLKSANIQGFGKGEARLAACEVLRTHGSTDFTTKLHRGPESRTVRHLLATGAQYVEIAGVDTQAAVFENGKFNTFDGAKIVDVAYVDASNIRSNSLLEGAPRATVYRAGQTASFVPVEYQNFGDEEPWSDADEQLHGIHRGLVEQGDSFYDDARRESPTAESARAELALAKVLQEQGEDAEARLRHERGGDHMLAILKEMGLVRPPNDGPALDH